MEKPCFEIGLVLAGAVSAGAYSAGVTDFLFEALDAYCEAKSRSGWTGPTHDVRVPVMAGASAGGMTAAIAALHAFRDLDHVWPGTPAPPPSRNRFYSSWVEDISIQALLDTADLDEPRGNAGVMSALCCDVLDRILDNVFNLEGPVRTRPWIGGSGGGKPTLRLRLTLTNLRGVPYSFEMFGADSNASYGMLNHGDYLDFTIGENPGADDGPQPLDVHDTGSNGWKQFRTGALATGAFPVGLAARPFSRSPSSYRDGNRVGWEDSMSGFHGIDPDKLFDATDPFDFVAVDGGMVDNEPLELARRYLNGGSGHNPRDGNQATKAVILIAPFPKISKMPEPAGQSRLVDLAPLLVSTLLEQSRFKPEELALAANDRVFSRFLISPERQDMPAAGKDPIFPIASGPLFGFGGFLDRSFRHHDYLLGRRNAQAFLRWNLVLPETNPLFDSFDKPKREQWYVREVGDQVRTIKDDSTFRYERVAETPEGARDTLALPIIPLVGRLKETPIEIGPQDHPCKDVDLAAIAALVRTRADRVIGTLVGQDLIGLTESHWYGGLLREGARHYGTEVVSNKALSAIKDALEAVRRSFP